MILKGRNFKVGTGSVDPTPTKIITNIKFDSAPTYAVATRPNIKYNKLNHLAFEWDDASVGAVTALTKLNNAFYTDGCGNNKNYSATLAINGANENTPETYPNDGYIYNTPDRATLSDMVAMINAGWEISDHSYYHDPVGKGALYTAYEMTVMMQTYIKNRLNYWTRTKVVPTNYPGHAQAAYDLGYLYSTSQGTFDSFTPVWMYAPPGDLSLVPVFGAIRRDFTDQWGTDLNSLKTIISGMLAQTNRFFRIGSHNLTNAAAFQDLLDYVVLNANDKLLVSSTRELFEYREIARLPTTQSLVGDTLTIETDITNLDPKNRWRDQSFVISTDKNILSVSTSNADGAVFNNTTKLVNVYKQVLS